MSRYTFSCDPQDVGELRNPSTHVSACPHRSTPPETLDIANHASKAPGRSDTADTRKQDSGGRERDASPRAYYVRDRAYLLRDSEMYSLKEIGRFRVVPVTDLATYGYDGDRERVEKDIRQDGCEQGTRPEEHQRVHQVGQNDRRVRQRSKNP